MHIIAIVCVGPDTCYCYCVSIAPDTCVSRSGYIYFIVGVYQDAYCYCMNRPENICTCTCYCYLLGSPDSYYCYCVRRFGNALVLMSWPKCTMIKIRCMLLLL